MKALAAVIAAIAFASVAAQGQGQFLFNTRDLAAGNNVQFEPLCYEGQIAPDYFIVVLAGPDATLLAALSPELPLSLTGAGASYPNPTAQIYTVPGMSPGMVATVAYEVHAVNMVSGYHLAQNQVVLTAPPFPPNEVALGNVTIPIYYCPEPSTWILGLLGLGAVFMAFGGQWSRTDAAAEL
jgi:hypothetical protein